MGVEFSILKNIDGDRSVPVLFSVVRNEMYFLPHFLRHYRALGVRQFLFLDDRSSDGTTDYLLAQPDCGVVRANLGFGDLLEGKRFSLAVKTLLPRRLMQGRWVLTVDADEFLVLPRAYATLDAMTRALQAGGLAVARALMFDFFPRTLRALEGADPASEPLALCPFFDAWETVDWPDRAIQPRQLSTMDGVRPRMFQKLLPGSEALRSLKHTYLVASMYKVPLVHWGAQTEMRTAHHCNVPPSDRVQLGLAHFKFVPGYRARIEDALATKAYWQNSIEYRFLDIAVRELQDWPLAGPRTRKFDQAQALDALGLVFSRLGS